MVLLAHRGQFGCIITRSKEIAHMYKLLNCIYKQSEIDCIEICSSIMCNACYGYDLYSIVVGIVEAYGFMPKNIVQKPASLFLHNNFAVLFKHNQAHKCPERKPQTLQQVSMNFVLFLNLRTKTCLLTNHSSYNTHVMDLPLCPISFYTTT